MRAAACVNFSQAEKDEKAFSRPKNISDKFHSKSLAASGIDSICSTGIRYANARYTVESTAVICQMKNNCSLSTPEASENVQRNASL
jgi:hypothetical protein